MDNALSPNLNAGNVIDAEPTTPGFAARVAAMPLRSKLSFVAGLAALAAAVLAMTLWSSQGDFRPVFTGLSDKDGGAVIAQLAAMNVPYRNEPGGTILVPASQVYDLRMKLAAAGLPKGGSGSSVGFELMDKTSIGQTQFNERLNFQRALEGELTRTITALADVADARVHLAMPQQNGFFREQQKPSASVMLTLRGGRSLDRAQVAGIVHLVSASVPELHPKAVSVLDHTGALISTPPDSGNGLDGQQLQYKQQVEANLNKRIFELLEPVVGRDNLRSTVTADVDFSQVESTAEEYKPNQGQNANASVRVQQTSESQNATPQQPTGVPGAATNQPPVPATAPINGASAPLQATQGGAGNNNSRRDASTQYELDKTVRVTRNATGVVRRLNAAVIVNHRTTVDPKGKSSSAPLPQAELDKLNELVKEALGFSAERGDSVKVVTAPFVQEKVETVEVPVWKQPWLLDMLRAAIVPVALVIVALIAVFGMVRPAIRAVVPLPPEEKTAQAAAGQQLDAVVDEQNLLPEAGSLPQLEAPLQNEKLEKARILARENPVAVANIIRGWISGEVE
ncbi:flagellar basal-body MS-ring/collar protein FliF [Pelomonas sp. SE-A7]|uniref:flagellar basal-body MS-ring/collar protein FliF n=1 Tax=Pelomonas sp. SE-A7 TaxID=3054953 RepID=UPI00259D2C6F|nr:flagellar basal-body MS-ring/collar protein FliF [Pelomonas sp. SE-A7]MDM4764499.1 flagellar basal-body MS-ring/collar protein FliF [Pelomonas sp. SE-A7]